MLNTKLKWIKLVERFTLFTVTLSLLFGCANSKQNSFVIESKPLTKLETQMLKNHLFVVGNDIDNIKSLLWRDIQAEQRINREEYLKHIKILLRSHNEVINIIAGKKVNDEILGFDSFFFTWALIKVNPKGKDEEILESVLRILHVWYGDAFLEDFLNIGKVHPTFFSFYQTKQSL